MRCLLILLIWLIATPGHTTELHFESGIRQNLLIELYTSEGCSSCPPAEAYLNRFRDHPGLWESYVPIAFHVDYWNHLGWRDRFSSSEYSARQRTYARHWQARTVYTPAFFLNGEAWRGWRHRELPPANDKNVGNLKVSIQGDELRVRFRSYDVNPGPLVLHVARLGMGRSTTIEAGENTGRKARHDFVVIGYQKKSTQQGHWRMQLPAARVAETGPQALAVWVTEVGNPVPVQATGIAVDFNR